MPGRARDAGRPAARFGQAEPAVRDRWRVDRPAGRDGARGRLPGRRRTDPAGSGQGRQSHRTGLPDNVAYGNPQLLQRPLPAHGARTAGEAGVSFEQRAPSPGYPGPGSAEAPRRKQGPDVPRRRDRPDRGNRPRPVAGRHPRDGCRGTRTRQPHHLRDLRPGSVAREVALQGNLGRRPPRRWRR